MAWCRKFKLLFFIKFINFTWSRGMQCHNLFFIIYDLSAEQSVYTCWIYITYIYILVYQFVLVM